MQPETETQSMNVQVTGHHVEITPALREYVTGKMERLERHLGQMLEAHVILNVEKERNQAEARIEVAGATLFADATTDDMYAAIDALVDKLDSQAKKHKDKSNDHHAASARRAERPA